MLRAVFLNFFVLLFRVFVFEIGALCCTVLLRSRAVVVTVVVVVVVVAAVVAVVVVVVEVHGTRVLLLCFLLL